MDNKIAQRFWDKVKIGDGCWEWQAGKRKHGYGSFRTDKGPQKAHRVAYELWHGTDPSNKNVLHLCGNPACCRPDHLVLGDQKENMRHMKEHGRSLIGHKNHATKLTEAQVFRYTFQQPDAAAASQHLWSGAVSYIHDQDAQGVDPHLTCYTKRESITLRDGVAARH